MANAIPGRPGFLYVVSWEVANPGGGVHTVLSSASPFVHAAYGDDLLFIGPDLWAQRGTQAAFVEDPVPPRLAALCEERDVPVRFGRWNVNGSPPVALVDFGRMLEGRNRILGDLWSHHGVDSIHADWDTVERILFAYAAGILLEMHYVAVVRPRGLRAAAHFHQWQAAAGLLRIARSTPEVGTVYTPHGTALGRELASRGVALARALPTIDPEARAKELGIEAQHTLERAAAREASVLAVVSENTLEEATRLLGRRPDLVTPNGFEAGHPRDPRHRHAVRDALLSAAERFLGSPLDRKRTRIVFSSGRYEFHNKGFGVAIRALGKLAAGDPRPPRPLLFLVFVNAAKTGGRTEVMQRLKSPELAGEPCGICTHNLARPDEDPITTAAAAAGLVNRPDDPVKLVFVPVLLDGRDPLFPYSHMDILEASDLSVFPSLYEPWGYTPVESLAAGVPTVTTDVTGFGRFALSLPEEERAAVTVLPVAGHGDDEEALADALARELAAFLATSDDELEARRRAGDAALARMSWSKLVTQTLEAHRLAFTRAAERVASATSAAFTPISRRALVGLEARSEERPRLHTFTVTAALPKKLARLEDLARNLWWCWHAPARRLFEAVDADAFERAGGNPVRFLRTVAPERLVAAAKDKAFLEHLATTAADLDLYCERAPAGMPKTAYFCAEFALHESLPVYSGGLGVLAGDHLKSASDLAYPLCAVGLRYAHGYFVQRIEADGSQGVRFERTDVRDTPLVEVKDDQGAPLRVQIPMPERPLQAGVWRVDVGCVPLFLLDTMVPENDPTDRELTHRLYPSDREPRLRQEILLGIGGWRVLRKLGRLPEVCHLNEGHSAFLLLERLIDLADEEGLTFAEACEVVRATTVFTTHTPVPAGHDRFHEGLMRRYFGHVAERLGLSWDEFLDLGRTSRDDHDFSMTVLALRLCGHANGVSRLHGDVSRDMLADVWPGLHRAETPVESVTNGVHLPTWVGPEMDALFRSRLDKAWETRQVNNELWAEAEHVPDAELWEAHVAQKRRMTAYLRRAVEAVGMRNGESPAALRRRVEGIDDDALWIGYARRFAPYKRATLLFRDPDRIEALLSDPERPVRLVFAGKSHPDDREGAELVRRVVELTHEPRFAGRVFFVENYDMAVARVLVQGADVWLNTPTRPLEASGTSGMKACLNGVLHASILDGWWCEGHDGLGGWAFGDGIEHASPEMQAEYDSRSLYALLESHVVPLFFRREENGLPAGWIERMRHTLETVPVQFNTDRMVHDYGRTAYRPLAARGERTRENGFARARENVQRQQRLREAWSGVHIEDVSIPDPSRGLAVGEYFEVRARVRLGSLHPDDVVVELYVGPSGEAEELREPITIPLVPAGEPEHGVAEFTGSYLPRGTGSFRYGVRVLPAAESATQVAHMGLVRWA